MKKFLGRLALLGALVGGVVAVRGLLSREAAGTDVVQITFDDGSIRSLASNTPEGEELHDIARKLVETGF